MGKIQNKNENLYRWIAGGLGSALIFAIGLFLGDILSWSRVEAHAKEAGHPQTIERVNALEVRVDDQITAMLQYIEVRMGSVEGRIDRQNETLTRIENKMDRFMER